MDGQTRSQAVPCPSGVLSVWRSPLAQPTPHPARSPKPPKPRTPERPNPQSTAGGGPLGRGTGGKGGAGGSSQCGRPQERAGTQAPGGRSPWARPGCGRGPEGGHKKRAGPWGGDGPARGGVSTITLCKGCRAHCRQITTLRSRPATARRPSDAGNTAWPWPDHGVRGRRKGVSESPVRLARSGGGRSAPPHPGPRPRCRLDPPGAPRASRDSSGSPRPTGPPLRRRGVAPRSPLHCAVRSAWLCSRELPWPEPTRDGAPAGVVRDNDAETS